MTQHNITIGKTQKIIAVETGKFNETTQAFIFAYGLKQLLNDCHSAVKRADFETNEEFTLAVNEAVETKLQALIEGKVSIRSGSSREPVDPIEKLVFRQAKDIISNAIKAKGIKIKDVAPEKLAELIAGYIEKNREALVKEAKAQLKKAEAITVDLGDLDL